jgi:hypothetical protein
VKTLGREERKEKEGREGGREVMEEDLTIDEEVSGKRVVG